MLNSWSLCKYHSAQAYRHWCSLHLIKRSQILRSVFQNIESEVLTAMSMNSSIFWDITPCSRLNFNRRFGGICRLHLLGRRISQARNEHVAWLYLPIARSLFLAWLILRPRGWRWHSSPKRRLTLNGLHWVISQTLDLFYISECLQYEVAMSTVSCSYWNSICVGFAVKRLSVLDR
jgi:hypothetical protein